MKIYPEKEPSGFYKGISIKPEHVEKYKELHKKFRGKWPTIEELQEEIKKSACWGCSGCGV